MHVLEQVHQMEQEPDLSHYGELGGRMDDGDDDDTKSPKEVKTMESVIPGYPTLNQPSSTFPDSKAGDV